MRVREIEFTLEDPISVAISGTMRDDVVDVVLKAPSAKHRVQAGRIQKRCMSTIVQQSETKGDRPVEKKEPAEPSESSDMTGDDLITILSVAYQASDDIFAELFNDFSKILAAGCGTVGGEPISPTLFDKISFEDAEKMFGEYVVTFLLASLTKSGDGTK